jgi:drug/metabolite transporter (DMT)-like permease
LPSTSFSAIFTNLPLLAETLTAMVTSLPILTGYGLYAIVTALLVLALRDGELSILYPVISLTYVWVTFLSLAFLGESLNLYKILGICIIVAGVGVLGKDGKK